MRSNEQVSEELLEQLSQLPMTDNLRELQSRASSLSQWKTALQRGVLPDAKTTPFPDAAFSQAFTSALKDMEMARFTRRHPALLDSLLKQMLTLVKDYEERLIAAQAEQESEQNDRPPEQQQQQSSAASEGGEGEEQDMESAGGQAGEMTEDEIKEALENAKEQMGANQGERGKQLEMQLEQSEGQQGKGEEGEQEGETAGADAQEMAESIASDIMEEFKEEWAPAMENLEAADAAFDNLEDLMDGPKGFDLSRNLWQSSGWKELEKLRRNLENLKELRELVRQLGRSGGRGPRRRAPREVEATGKPPGMVQSPLQPEETSGLARSGDISLMLPAEQSLIAKGWPRTDSLNTVDFAEASTDESDWSMANRPGSRAARMLHMARRAERNLLSYERTGWLEDVPSRVTGHFEIRPAAEQGPIIVCLDTSGSMRGPRETVAKALALECMRGAHRQQRKCYLYAFSGPGEVNEFELKLEARSLETLLQFLANSFEGGTDVDAPLIRSLQRLGEEEWAQADILMVTDGEIRPPGEEVMTGLHGAVNDLGLEVHGVIVGNDTTQVMRDLCTHIHVFKSWTAVTS